MISFLVPFRDADGSRSRVLKWVLAAWQKRYPHEEFVVASDDGIDPFNKSLAVNKAFRQSHGDIIVILDADTVINPAVFDDAVRMIEDGRAPWVIPATVSWRLDKGTTIALLASEPSMTAALALGRGTVEQVARVVGFCHVLPRTAFQAVGGMDERFRGWGGEDAAFGMAVDTLVGPHERIASTLVSLWHERPRDRAGRRVWLGQFSRSANSAFFHRYSAARGIVTEMSAVLREAKAPLWKAAWYRRRTSTGVRTVHVTFVCRKLPALMIRFGDRKFKFIGGKLTVSGEDAETIRRFAAKRYEYGIVEETPAPTPAVATVAEPTPEPEAFNAPEPEPETADATDELMQLSNNDLRNRLEEIGENVSGNKVELVERLRAAYTEQSS